MENCSGAGLGSWRLNKSLFLFCSFQPRAFQPRLPRSALAVLKAAWQNEQFQVPKVSGALLLLRARQFPSLRTAIHLDAHDCSQMSQNPLVPTYVLRGHSSAIHALEFFASNIFLASGDTDGWLVIWRLSFKRPVAVWKAHEGGVMQIKHWTSQRLIT